MKKTLLIIGAVATSVLLSSCGGKDVKDEQSPIDNVRKSLENYNQSCVDKHLIKTKDQVLKANKFLEENNSTSAKEAEVMAVEFFKAEDPEYKAAADNLNIEAQRLDQSVARLEGFKNDPQISSSKIYKELYPIIDNHFVNAGEALNNCDPETAKVEIDEANKLLDQIDAGEQAPVVSEVSEKRNTTQYTVKKGDTLWFIADKEYTNAFLWPVIYWTNQEKIKDPDLIFPKQVFDIVHDSSDEEKGKAEHFAKTRGKWSLFDGK